MVGARSCNVSDDAANKKAAPNPLVGWESWQATAGDRNVWRASCVEFLKFMKKDNI
jgi:hypothetical protein